MKIIEVLKFNRELMERLHSMDVKLEDVKYVDLYVNYESMRRQGEKVTYIVAVLSQKYAVSERKIYSIIKRFGTSCTDGAV